jgi:hypothetical protein
MRYALIAIMGVALAGCGLELLAGTAIQSELQSQQMSNIKPTLDYAKNTGSTLSVQQAVDTYAAEMGAYPPSLNVLVPEWLPSIPEQADGTPFNYDPTTGRVTDGPAPPARPAPTPQRGAATAQTRQADQRQLEEVRRAIDRYGQTTGYYPASLEVLVPYYLATVPKTSTGMDFVYDPQTGALSLPPQPAATLQPQVAQPVPQRPAPRRPAAGGGGPMTEALTGIGIQQELNSMSNAGTSAAGSRLRQQAKDLGKSRQ